MLPALYELYVLDERIELALYCDNGLEALKFGRSEDEIISTQIR